MTPDAAGLSLAVGLIIGVPLAVVAAIRATWSP